jgi:hypothetical protein
LRCARVLLTRLALPLFQDRQGAQSSAVRIIAGKFEKAAG